MDEMSWQARLAKSNINILDMHDNRVFFEFTYHPKAGVFKWCKTTLPMVPGWSDQETAESIERWVLKFRKELED